MKILLDIDGVMIPARSWQNYEIDSDGFGMFSEKAVEGLNEILKSSINPEIILTTSHKHKFTLNKWKIIFSKRGIQITSINRLPTNSLDISRFEEIRQWFLLNQNEPFIIIDDEKRLNEFDSNFKDDHLILTNSTIGLNTSATSEAIEKIHQQEHFIY